MPSIKELTDWYNLARTALDDLRKVIDNLALAATSPDSVPLEEHPCMLQSKTYDRWGAVKRVRHYVQEKQLPEPSVGFDIKELMQEGVLRKDILRGRYWSNGIKCYFRLKDVREYLKIEGFTINQATRNRLAKRIRLAGGGSESLWLYENKLSRCWYLLEGRTAIPPEEYSTEVFTVAGGEKYEILK